MMWILLILAVIGFCVSLYAYFVEKKIKAEPNYQAACDLSERVSCTKAMKSSYGTLFYVSNALIGMLFYVAVAVLAFFQLHIPLLVLAIASNVIDLVLAYILLFKIKALCPLCISVYLINALILLVVLFKLF